MKKREIIWECKIGGVSPVDLPHGADFPMRAAIDKAFREVSGIESDFIFSGWGGSLTTIEDKIVKHYRMSRRIQ